MSNKKNHIQLPTHNERWSSKELEEVAGQLPASFDAKKRYLKGNVLIAEIEAHNLNADEKHQRKKVDSEGRPYELEKFYRLEIPTRINHKRRIRRAYKRGGKAGVIDCIQKFYYHHQEIMKRFSEFFTVTNEADLIKQNT